MASFLGHDSMATESMGPRFDRSREHLGVSDTGVIVVRHRLLEAVQAFERGEDPPHVVMTPERNDMRHVTSFAEMQPDDDWRAHYPWLNGSLDEAGVRAPAATH